MKKSFLVFAVVLFGIIVASCNLFFFYALSEQLYGGGDSWQAKGPISMESSDKKTMTLEDYFYGLEKKSKGKSISEEYSASVHANIKESSTSLAYTGTVEEDGDTITSVVADESKATNKMNLKFTYDEDADELSGDIAFDYEGTNYNGTTELTRIE